MTDTPFIACRGVRGAITVEANTADAILEAARELLEALIAANHIAPDDIASVLFTATPDLNAIYPAVAARQLGWHDVALNCVQEMDVPGSLPRCLRVLILWNTPLLPHDIHHLYLREAHILRPDRMQSESVHSSAS